MSHFATELKIAMARKGISATELAKRLGVTRGAVSNWRSGSALPEIRRIHDIERELDVARGALLNAVAGPPTISDIPRAPGPEHTRTDFTGDMAADETAGRYRTGREDEEIDALAGEIAELDDEDREVVRDLVRRLRQR